MFPIGQKVLVKQDVSGTHEREENYVGSIGTFIELNEHNEDGDFYGVQFLEDKNTTVYFWLEELEAVHYLREV